jgi:hypothetical protein
MTGGRQAVSKKISNPGPVIGDLAIHDGIET